MAFPSLRRFVARVSGVTLIHVVVVHAYARLPLQFVLCWLGIARTLARAKALHLLLAAGTPEGVVPSLEALSRLMFVPLF